MQFYPSTVALAGRLSSFFVLKWFGVTLNEGFYCYVRTKNEKCKKKMMLVKTTFPYVLQEIAVMMWPIALLFVADTACRA